MSTTVDLVKDSTMKDVAKAIREISGHYDLSDYKSIVAAIRNGHGDLIPNGTCFQVPHAVYGNIDFITRRQNVDKVAFEPDRPTLTIQTKYCISVGAGTSAASFQYDRPEAFVKIAEAIEAGSVCKFTATNYGGWTAGVYHFTATDAIPVGAVLCLSGYQNTALTSLNVQVYANQKATSASASYAISSGDGDATVDLGAWETAGHNHPQRISYGSNNEADSNIFQFLNGDSGNAYMDSIWVPKSDFDMMCTSYTSLKGFLGGFRTTSENASGSALFITSRTLYMKRLATRRTANTRIMGTSGCLRGKRSTDPTRQQVKTRRLNSHTMQTSAPRMPTSWVTPKALHRQTRSGSGRRPPGTPAMCVSSTQGVVEPWTTAMPTTATGSARLQS